jgi:hypothetical protein
MATRLNLHAALLLALFAAALPVTCPAAWPEDELVTRTYKLDVLKIKSLAESDIGATLATSPSPSDLLRALLRTMGITFPPNLIRAIPDSKKMEKAFYLNERTGELHLRATRRDIPQFEKYLAYLSLPPDLPRGPVEIQTILVEVSLADPPLINRLVTVQPAWIFTNLATLNGFTNVIILTEKGRETALNALRNSQDASITELPAASVSKGQKLHILGPDLQYRPSGVPALSPYLNGTLIIRSESDLR